MSIKKYLPVSSGSFHKRLSNVEDKLNCIFSSIEKNKQLSEQQFSVVSDSLKSSQKKQSKAKDVLSMVLKQLSSLADSIKSSQNEYHELKDMYSKILEQTYALSGSIDKLQQELVSFEGMRSELLRKQKNDVEMFVEKLADFESKCFGFLSPGHNNRQLAALMFEKENEDRKRKTIVREALFREKAIIPPLLDTPLTEDELKEINDFWEPYSFAYINDPETQRIFSRISGRFDPSYISDGLMRNEVRRYYHDPSTYLCACHKNFLARQFPAVKQPYAYVYKTGGQYFDNAYSPISLEQALTICLNAMQSSKTHDATQKPNDFVEIIVKPADTTGDGQNIYFVDNQTDKKTLTKIFKNYTVDFICQKVLKNHPSFSAPCSKAINTLRLVTLIWENKIQVVGCIFRMSTGKRVDNIHQGGIGCAVSENGVCGDFATDACGNRFYTHPSGFKFAGHKLYGYDKAVETAKYLHSRVPQQKYIAWDLTVDEEGDVVFIEMNSPGTTNVLQTVGINPLKNKELAKEILDEALINQFFYERANNDYDFREFAKSISIVKYYGDDEIVEIPETILEKPVLVIYDNAFINPKIKEIRIPKTVKLRQEDFSKCAPGCKTVFI